MSENNENKNVTAKDLLKRLGQTKNEGEKKESTASFSECVENKEKEPAAPEFPERPEIEENIDRQNFEQDNEPAEVSDYEVQEEPAEVFDYEAQEESAAEIPSEETPVVDENQDLLDSLQMFEEIDAPEYERPEEEFETVEEYEEEPIADEYSEYIDEIDTYGDEYYEDGTDIPELSEEEINQFEESAGYNGEYEGEYSEELDGNYTEYAEESAPYYPENAEDIIPEDEFFDEDPLEETDEMFNSSAEEEEYDEEYYEDETNEEEPDREDEFKSLVEEVTGDAEYDDPELSENDINLMVALGMEDQLAKTVGEETAAQMTEDYVADQEEWVDRANRFGAEEYSSPAENGEIAEMYKKRNKIATIKMIIAIALTAVILFFENLPVIGYQLSGALDPRLYPVVYVMVDLQIVVLAIFAAWRNVKQGLSDLIKFKTSVNIIPALAAIAAIVGSALTAYSAVPGKDVAVYNFPVVLCLMMAAINEYLTVRREIFSFNIISSKKPKFVMRNLSTRDAALETEAIADLDMDTSAADEGDVIKIQETDFVDGYFWRTNLRPEANLGFIKLSVVIAVGLAVLVGVYAGVSKSTSVISGVYATLVAALPASMALIGAYPFYRANKSAYDNGSTIIGEASVEEYSGVGVISFDDVNVFPAANVKVRNVRLYNNSRIDKVLYYAASVFSATGGPLSDVFEVATMETGHSENVTVLETGSGYIEATVNGKSIMFGRASALAKVGIIIPEDVVSETEDLPADCSVMYMIYQHKLVSKMVVNYVVEPDFEYILKQLTGSGMCVCIKTFDPNIDEEMIYRQMRSAGKYSMRVIKYKSTDEITKYSKHAEGGVVSRGNTKSLLHTVSSCDRILSAQRTGYIIGVLSAIFGAAIVGIMLLAGSFDKLYSLYIVLCQAIWLIPALASTKVIVK